MEGAGKFALRLARCVSPNDAYDARVVAGPNLTNRPEFPVISPFRIQKCESAPLEV